MKTRVKINFCDFGGPDFRHIFLHGFLHEHYKVVNSSSPDFLLYSSKGKEHREHDCTKIFFTDESIYPDFSVCDYALTCFHSTNPRHLRLPSYVTMGDGSELVKSAEEMSTPPPARPNFCSFLVSNIGRRTRHRINFFQELDQRRRVNSAGSALNNTGQPLPPGHRLKIDFLRSYRFNIAFENKAWPGYNTEKLYQAMAARCIPIYYGDPLIAQEFNPRSYINYHDFESVDALIDHVIKVDNDPELQFAYQREPFFYENRPNLFFSQERLKTFFDQILEGQIRGKKGSNLIHKVRAKTINTLIKAQNPK